MKQELKNRNHHRTNNIGVLNNVMTKLWRDRKWTSFVILHNMTRTSFNSWKWSLTYLIHCSMIERAIYVHCNIYIQKCI